MKKNYGTAKSELAPFLISSDPSFVPAEYRGRFGYGDVCTWVATDADTKLVPCWLVGKRDAGYASEFITDLACRLANRVQLTTDDHKAYLTAIEDTFGIVS